MDKDSQAGGPRGRTAQIIEFPGPYRKGRRSEDLKSRLSPLPTAIIPMSIGDCWYHEAAIREDENG